MIVGQTIRTNYITLTNFGEPQNDGDTTNGTTADRNSNLTIDFGIYKTPVPVCSTDPKCSPVIVRKTNQRVRARILQICTYEIKKIV